jgi:Fic family protein
LLAHVRRDRGASVAPGEFKQHQNFIGAYDIEHARFVPPPPAETLACLDALERYWHRDEDDGFNALIDAALIHYQFETIHPFADGNGRVGRMLILLHLFTRKKISQPLLYLSPVFEARKAEYIDRMFAVSRDGDWEGWIVFFLQVLRDAARETIVLAERLIALQASYRVQMQQARRSSNLLTIIDYLFEQPVLTIPMIAERLDVTYKGAQKNVELLIAERVLSEVEGTSNPRYFAARDIIKITSGK